MNVVFQGFACVDCVSMIANADASDMTDAQWNQWESGVYATALEEQFNGHAVMACPDDCEGEFRTDPCDYCGSALAGDRHPIAVLSSDRYGQYR